MERLEIIIHAINGVGWLVLAGIWLYSKRSKLTGKLTKEDVQMSTSRLTGLPQFENMPPPPPTRIEIIKLANDLGVLSKDVDRRFGQIYKELNLLNDIATRKVDFGTSTVSTKASDIEANQTKYANYPAMPAESNEFEIKNQTTQPEPRLKTVEDVRQWCKWHNANMALSHDYLYGFNSGAESLFKAMQEDKTADVPDHKKGKKAKGLRFKTNKDVGDWLKEGLRTDHHLKEEGFAMGAKALFLAMQDSGDIPRPDKGKKGRENANK